jgi:hypothetical protein
MAVRSPEVYLVPCLISLRIVLDVAKVHCPTNARRCDADPVLPVLPRPGEDVEPALTVPVRPLTNRPGHSASKHRRTECSCQERAIWGPPGDLSLVYCVFAQHFGKRMLTATNSRRLGPLYGLLRE